MENVELTFRKLAKETANRIFATILLDQISPNDPSWEIDSETGFTPRR
jgi:hypothetical protein